MSAWDAYITSNLMAPVDSEGNTLDSAAILGQDGGIWAQSSAFPEITPDEIAKLLVAFDDSSVPAVFIAGVKYMKLGSSDTVVRARKDKTGFIACKSQTAITIGFYTDPPVSAQTCNKVVEAMGEYLTGQGY